MRLFRSHTRASSVSVAVAVCCAVVGLSAPPAAAQSDADRSTARALGLDGQKALDNKDYKSAEDRYRRAESFVHAPTLMIGLARALAGEGKYVEAQETYNRIVREGLPPSASEPFKRALADAKKEVETVSPKIGGVIITVHTAGGADIPEPKVLLDGAPVSAASLGVTRSVDPGSHVLQVSADGYKPAELRFDVAEGGSATQAVSLDVDPNAAPAASTPSTTLATSASTTAAPSGGGARAVLPWVAFGLGGVGLVTGAIAGVVAMGKHTDLANACTIGTNGVCPQDKQPDLDSYHTVAAVSTAGFIVGGVGIAAGAILLITRPKTEHVAPSQPAQSAVRIIPVIGPMSLGAVGTF